MTDSKYPAITQFETLFALRTGLTLLLPKNDFFNLTPKDGFKFTPKDGENTSLVILADNEEIMLKGLKAQLLENSVEKGFIMFYETNKKDEVVRNTVCRLKKA